MLIETYRQTIVDELARLYLMREKSRLPPSFSEYFDRTYEQARALGTEVWLAHMLGEAIARLSALSATANGSSRSPKAIPPFA